MKSPILVFDNSKFSIETLGPIINGKYRLEHYLDRQIHVVRDMSLARGFLEHGRDYGAFLTEPFMYFRNPDLERYQNFLKDVREKYFLNVILWTTESKKEIKEDYGLELNVNYDYYVRKGKRQKKDLRLILS